MNKLTQLGAAFCVAMVSCVAMAQNIEVKNAWVRATVQGQKATGAFMTLTSKEDVTFVSAASPVAGVVEVHEMKLINNVMSMRALQGGLQVPAGKAVELKPGGYHVMLLDLKLPLKKDTTIPMTLVFKNAKGVESKTELKVPVLTAPPVGVVKPDHGGHGMHH